MGSPRRILLDVPPSTPTHAHREEPPRSGMLPSRGMSATFDDEEAQFVAHARQQADIFENIHNHSSPSPQVQRERFRALLVDSGVASLDAVLAALVDFARPALEHSQTPEEMFAWACRAGDHHLVFYGSTPKPGAWMEGEELMERFGTLPAYYHLEHDKKDPRFDRLVELDADDTDTGTDEEGSDDDRPLRLMSTDHSDHGRPPEVGNAKLDQNDPWKLLHERTGLRLTDLRAAIAQGKSFWLICRGVIVLPGVERNRVPVRRAVKAAPAPPPPPPSFDEVVAGAEQAWVARFEGDVFRYARRLDRPELTERLIASLQQKGPRPRTARVAMAALGMVGAVEAAPVLVAWTNKTSEPLRHAAMGALAMLEERARPALVAGSGARRALEKKACVALLRVLDDRAFQPLRDLRAARARAAQDAAAGRLTDPDLFAINAQDLDWKPRVAEREALIREGGAALAAAHFTWKLQRVDAGAMGMVLAYESILALVAGDPLGPWVLPLVLLEHPLGDTFLSGLPSRDKLSEAARALGPPFKSALITVNRLFSGK